MMLRQHHGLALTRKSKSGKRQQVAVTIAFKEILDPDRQAVHVPRAGSFTMPFPVITERSGVPSKQKDGPTGSLDPPF